MISSRSLARLCALTGFVLAIVPLHPAPSLAQAAQSATLKLPAYLPFSDHRNFVLLGSMVYQLNGHRESIVIPRGFVTDLASIPNLFQSAIPTQDSHGVPAILHDFLYWEGTCSQEQADRLFLKAMEDMRVSYPKRTIMYGVLSVGGGEAYRANATHRRLGYTRVLPITRVESVGEELQIGLPAPFRLPHTRERWPEYREYLRKEGFRPASTRPVSEAFCRLGGPSARKRPIRNHGG